MEVLGRDNESSMRQEATLGVGTGPAKNEFRARGGKSPAQRARCPPRDSIGTSGPQHPHSQSPHLTRDPSTFRALPPTLPQVRDKQTSQPLLLYTDWPLPKHYAECAPPCLSRYQIKEIPGPGGKKAISYIFPKPITGTTVHL